MKYWLWASLVSLCPDLIGAAEVDDLLKPLVKTTENPSGEIDFEEDEVVLLSTSRGMADFLQLSNTPTPGAPLGRCLGITQAQLALLASLQFDSRQPRDSEEQIYQKLKKALNSTSGETLTINGFHDSADFIAAQTKALERVIDEFQSVHGVEVKQDGSAALVQGRPAMPTGVENLTSGIEQAAALARKLESRIQSKMPSQLVVFPTKDQKAPGHAVVVVGYVKKKGSQQPDRFLVVDPNFPRKLKILKQQDREWTLDLPSSSGVQLAPTRVVAGLVRSPNSDIRDQKLANVFHKQEISPKGFRTCEPKSEIAAILGHSH
jgi:ADP-ribose pyrophosphatase YjhB (NUDIX family)